MNGWMSGHFYHLLQITLITRATYLLPKNKRLINKKKKQLGPSTAQHASHNTEFISLTNIPRSAFPMHADSAVTQR